jgi:hypothetical protein
MYAQKRLLIVIILIGGMAVLGSYILGALTIPDAGQILWGGVPQGIRSFITVNMFLAAAGYFAFTYFILFCLDPVKTQVTSRFGFGLFNALYTAILIPSALWLPLTFLAVKQSSSALGGAARLDLGIAAIASLGLFAALLVVKPSRPLWAHRLSLIGCVFFCIQTVILDAIVWGIFFQL